MTDALGRVARLTVQQTDPVANADEGGWFRRTGTNAVVIEGLRMTFSIMRGKGARPKPVEIKIHNLSESTRADLGSLPASALLEAGYRTAPLHRVASGDLRRARPTHEGTSVITTLEIADGDRAWRGATLDRPYRRNVPVIEVIRDAARSCGLSLPPAVEADPSLRTQLAGGYVATGGALQQLERLLRGYGYDVSVQGGSLQVLSDDKPRPGEAIVYDSQHLVGAPQIGTKGRVSFRVQLDPRLYPGQLVQLRSRELSGGTTWSVVTVKLEGDTRGGAWHTTCEATPWG